MTADRASTSRSQVFLAFSAATVVGTFYAVASIVGAATSVGVGLVATVVASALYVVSTLVWCAVVVVTVSSARRARRGDTLDLAGLRFVAFAPPIGGTVLLAAAYVARMNGQPFVGGFEAMVVTTVALVVLSRVLPALGFGSATQASALAPAPAPAPAPTDTQRQSSGGGGASS